MKILRQTIWICLLFSNSSFSIETSRYESLMNSSFFNHPCYKNKDICFEVPARDVELRQDSYASLINELKIHIKKYEGEPQKLRDIGQTYLNLADEASDYTANKLREINTSFELRAVALKKNIERDLNSLSGGKGVSNIGSLVGEVNSIKIKGIISKYHKKIKSLNEIIENYGVNHFGGSYSFNYNDNKSYFQFLSPEEAASGLSFGNGLPKYSHLRNKSVSLNSVVETLSFDSGCLSIQNFDVAPELAVWLVGESEGQELKFNCTALNKFQFKVIDTFFEDTYCPAYNPDTHSVNLYYYEHYNTGRSSSRRVFDCRDGMADLFTGRSFGKDFLMEAFNTYPKIESDGSRSK